MIECKDYASKISIDKIDAFLGKTADIPGLRLIYATKTGYQKGATTKAKKHNIDLLIIKECNDEDFISQEGISYITGATINIMTICSPRIISFYPIVDRNWLNAQPDLNKEIIKNRFRKGELNNNLFIVNKITGGHSSFMELANSLAKKYPT